MKGPASRSNKIVSEAEAQSNCGVEVVALEKAVCQSAVHFREHQPGVEIPLRGKLPIDNAGYRVKRTGALRVLAAGAGQRPRGGGAADDPVLRFRSSSYAISHSRRQVEV
jgi:hypothetical protein